MTQIVLEHINFTVRDAKATAEELSALFDWKIRWHGDSREGLGDSYHVGSEDTYLALYSPKEEASEPQSDNYITPRALNHIGVVVPDMDAMEQRVKAAGYTPGPHHDYEPGRRFYFFNRDGIEFEIVDYS